MKKLLSIIGAIAIITIVVWEYKTTNSQMFQNLYLGLICIVTWLIVLVGCGLIYFTVNPIEGHSVDSIAGEMHGQSTAFISVGHTIVLAYLDHIVIMILFVISMIFIRGVIYCVRNQS